MTNPKYAITNETGRTYSIPGYEDIVFNSVTSLLGIIAKPALYRWYAKQVAEYAVMNVPMFEGEPASDAIKRLSSAPFEALTKSQDLGSAVHKGVELYAESLLGEGSEKYREFIEQNPHIRPYVETFENFLKREGWTVVASERTVFDPENGYAGTLDLILSDGTSNFVVDIKTGGVYPTHALQMVAYARAKMYIDKRGYAQVNTIPIKGSFVLQLKPSTAKANYMDIDDAAFDAFLAARDLSLWVNKNSKKVVLRG